MRGTPISRKQAVEIAEETRAKAEAAHEESVKSDAIRCGDDESEQTAVVSIQDDGEECWLRLDIGGLGLEIAPRYLNRTCGTMLAMARADLILALRRAGVTT